MNKFETSSYKTIKSALVNRNLKQALYDEGKVIMDGVLLTLHGEEHRKRRKQDKKQQNRKKTKQQNKKKTKQQNKKKTRDN